MLSIKNQKRGLFGTVGGRALAFVLVPAMATTVAFGVSLDNDTGDGDPNQNFDGTVENLQLLNVDDLRQRDVVIDNPQFIPPANGHFNIATLDWDENIGPGNDNDLWWDVEIKVTRSGLDIELNRGVMISIDKDVTNNTNLHWTDFHMTVGRGVGDDFVESDEFDWLYFKTEPAPLNKAPGGFPDPVKGFDDPPMQDEPIAPDNLWWFADNTPGVAPGQTTAFWLGINVPDSMFDASTDPSMVTITLREHASIPEPTTFMILGVAAAVLLPRRRSSNV